MLGDASKDPQVKSISGVIAQGFPGTGSYDLGSIISEFLSGAISSESCSETSPTNPSSALLASSQGLPEFVSDCLARVGRLLSLERKYRGDLAIYRQTTILSAWRVHMAQIIPSSPRLSIGGQRNRKQGPCSTGPRAWQSCGRRRPAGLGEWPY